MQRRTIRLPAAIIASLLTAAAWTASAAAAPQHLDCVLTDKETQPGSENRPVAVVFDEDNKTLTAELAGHSYSFSNVTITYISISGQAEDISIGIDRSSLGLVWQQYGGDKVTTEFGRCRAAPAPH